jgi:phosphoribosylformylglycinamidine cyclo-ligase
MRSLASGLIADTGELGAFRVIDGLRKVPRVSNTTGKTYRDAGVDLDAADQLVARIAPAVRRTYGPRVLPSHGAFAGLFRLDYDSRLFARNYRDPVLVSCTDGVGSKLLIAVQAERYDTVGADLVAMNVNDLLTCGAEPLFFLDYVAVHKLEPDVVARLVEGIAAGCEQAGCALLGGETAEMPDLYRPDHFDLAGFAVGVVERRRMMQRKFVRPGDDLIGLTSSGLHSNGYALVRRLLLKDVGLNLNETVRTLGEPLIDALLRPTRIYARSVLKALGHYRGRPRITGMAHITGGGLPGNVPRMLPRDCDAVIDRGSWPVPPIFGLLEHYGVGEEEMYRVFNMGIGYVLAVHPKSTTTVAHLLERAGEQAFVIGRIKRGRGQMELH